MVLNHTELTMTTESESKTTKISQLHKLRYKWNLWAHLPQDQDWSAKGYKNIHQFTTVEETIAVTETLPDTLVKNCMLFIMRDGILPMWEDVKNRNGGCFSYKVLNKHVNEVWRDLTYVLVGDSVSNNLPFVNSVTGITISPKKNFCIVKIWMTNCEYQNPSIITSDINNIDAKGCLFKKHTPEF